MSSDGKGFNVTAAPFQPRSRANSTGESRQKVAEDLAARAEEKIKQQQEQELAAKSKPESYSDRAKKAIVKEREAALAQLAKRQQQQQEKKESPNESKESKQKTSAASSVVMKPALVSSSKTSTADKVEFGAGDKKKNNKSDKHVRIPVRYTRDQMKELKASTWKWQLEAVHDEERVDHPPFSNIPKSYAKFFDCQAHLDWINWESPLMKVPVSRRGAEKSFGRQQGKNPPPVVPMDDAPALPPASAQSDYQQKQYSNKPRSGSAGSGNNRNWGMSPGLQAIAINSATCSPYLGSTNHSTPDSAGHSQQYSFHCTTCASPDSSCCEMIGTLIQSVKRKEKTQDHGFLTQAGDVVLGSVQILLAFEHRATSRRMKLLNERFPKVKALVKAYLCGEGFHIPPPALSNEDVWSHFLGRLKFDYIRDNRTKVFTELSKHWKRSHTKFEQFAHFAAFRDAVPHFPTIGMITNTQKPFIVSCSTGDVEATVLLGELGYTVMADVFWDMLPYYEELPNHIYAALRHLCVYYFKRQQRRVSQQANQYAQVAPSPALPPMRPGTSMSPIMIGMTSQQGPPPSPALAPAGVSA